MSSGSIAPVVWAQRKDTLLVNIDLQDVKDPQINLESKRLTFSGISSGKPYHVELDFLKEIDPKQSKYVVRPRNVEFVLHKSEPGPFWERLLSESGKRNWLKSDWNKWVDEDDVEKAEAFDTGGMEGFDMGNMPDFTGGGEGSDSDDEEIPGLEDEAEEKKNEEEEEEEKKEKKVDNIDDPN